MGSCNHKLTRVLAVLAFAVLPLAAAQSHPATGIYSFHGPDVTRTVEIHVAADGTLTGMSYSGRTTVGTYLEGRYENGRAQGTYHDSSLLHIAFLMEFSEDVLSYWLFPGSADSPPDPLPQADYLLRQPGDGPLEPIRAPLDVLVAQGRDDTIIATSPQGTTLRLADARRLLDLMSLAFIEAGLDGAPFPNRRTYVDWILRTTRIFSEAPVPTQHLLASSSSWWPPISDDWEGATPAQRLRVTQDVLLILFEEEALTGPQAFLEVEPGTRTAECDSVTCTALTLFDGADLAAAQGRAPCFVIGGCD